MLDVGSIKKLEDRNKTVLVRFDLNVPLDEVSGKVNDRLTRIKNTINQLQELNSKIVILSHLGRPKGTNNKDLSLSKITDQLEEVLNSKINFINDCIGDEVKKKINSFNQSSIILLENCRFHKGEEENNLEFAKKLSELADVYVNDAFGCVHRSHASVDAITQYMPSYVGNLLDEELTNLHNITEDPQSPSITILGGSKISTKISVLKNLSIKMDSIVICGGMANNFLAYNGHDIKDSLIEKDVDNLIKEIILHAEKNNCKLITPIDVVTATEIRENTKVYISSVNQIKDGTMILDIGPKTIDIIENELNKSKSVFWNGPAGVFETKPFDNGTTQIANLIAEKSINKLLQSFAGGGDTIAALELAGVKNKFSYVSTGGGALLELLEGKKLPGLVALGIIK
tara:strand:- start:2875 stop:4074 length:1200 start_codon:yes stop_codon:yes gene_type:complete